MDRTRDLGVLEGPLIAFGGPYGNIAATQALLAEADRLGVTGSRLICTGDVVGYCADPEATFDLLRGQGVSIVMGNCEESLAADANDCGCGFAENSTCDALSAGWYAFARRTVSPAAKAAMGLLPRALRFRFAGADFIVIHGGLSRINRFVFASDVPSIREELALAKADAVIAGHCGLWFTTCVEGRLWHNPGAIGLPANDGTPRVWYAMLRAFGNGIRIEHRSLGYPHVDAACRMHERGLSAAYADTLISGRWPSLEVLPPPERRETGTAMVPKTYHWEPPRRIQGPPTLASGVAVARAGQA